MEEVMSEQAPARASSSQCRGPAHHQTGLHRAAVLGNSDALAALIRGGCAVDLRDRDGNTALHEASWHGFSRCVKLLVEAGADVHIRNTAGNTALHLACQNAHAGTARLLLLGESAPDTTNNMGDTCLHVAARYNNSALVKLLLGSLCSVTERNQGGDTALHVAAALNHKRTVKLLLEAGTDGNVRNNAGKTALDKARDNNHKDVALLLARSPQIHRFTRRKTVMKWRKRLTAEHSAQSVTREILPHNTASRSVVDETTSGEQTKGRAVVREGPRQQQEQLPYHETPPAVSSPSGRRKRTKGQALSRGDPKKEGKNDFHVKRDPLCDAGKGSSAPNGKTYQLYTLYRDKDGNIRQTPANGCRCKPLLKKLEGQLRAVQEEMRQDLLNVQQRVNSRLAKMDSRNRRQIQVLDMLNEQKAAAERKTMIHRIDQRVAQEREETLMTQAAVGQELKRWCMSQLKDTDVHIPAKAQYYKLLPSPSVADTDLETFPLLSVVSGDSSTSLATYVNILPLSKSMQSLGSPDQETTGSRTYFEMRVDKSTDDYENTVLFPLPAKNTSGLLLSSVDPLWQPLGVQDGPVVPVVSACEEGFSSSSSNESTINDQERSHNRQYGGHFGELVSGHGSAGIHAKGTRTLEFFNDHPTEPTFVQERNNLHAKEVTQRFFETVSIQLERWYQRKIVEVEQQTKLRSQQDRKELLQQISMLEEELQRLKANEDAES